MHDIRLYFRPQEDHLPLEQMIINEHEKVHTLITRKDGEADEEDK